ncbi:MAG: hypothetical protein M1480_15360 [Bacteroidetes bacterium]|nr:hypothetical protein [Bacteroidota bacterium]
MKTIYSVVMLIAFIGLLIIGCSDKSNSPVESSATNYNTVSLQKGSAGSGAWVIRYESNTAFWFNDPESELVLTLGVNDISSLCSGAGGLDMFAFKDIYLPNADSNLRRIVEQMKGKDITAMIWQPDPWPSSFTSFCNFYNNFGPAMATGTVNFIYTDNDVYAWAQDNKNSNAFGYKANGTLMSQDGQVYKLNFVYRGVWDGVDLATYKETFKIQLTVTGKK